LRWRRTRRYRPFDRDQAEDAPNNWSSLRAQDLAEANLSLDLVLCGIRELDSGVVLECRVLGLHLARRRRVLVESVRVGFYPPRYIYHGGPVFRGYRSYAGHGFAQSKSAG
jgi:hypothetical protein